MAMRVWLFDEDALKQALDATGLSAADIALVRSFLGSTYADALTVRVPDVPVASTTLLDARGSPT